MQCSTRFTVNAQGTITNWAWQGNDCKAKEPEQLKQQNADQNNKKKEDNIKAFSKINDKYVVVCNTAEYAELFLKSPCNANTITMTHLADNTKITKEQKVILLKWRTDMDGVIKERNIFVRGVGNPLESQWADYVDSVQPDVDKYSLDLYNGITTWGEYNQIRKNLYIKMDAAHRSMFQTAK